jgi:hypothetical protein
LLGRQRLVRLVDRHALLAQLRRRLVDGVRRELVRVVHDAFFIDPLVHRGTRDADGRQREGRHGERDHRRRRDPRQPGFRVHGDRSFRFMRKVPCSPVSTPFVRPDR